MNLRYEKLQAAVKAALGSRAANRLHAHIRDRAALGMNPFNTGTIPTGDDFSRGRVTSPDQSEVSRGRLYDYQLYATAGTTQQQFFSFPVGQGVATAPGAAVGSTKTLADTNLQVANTLPSGKAFFVESIEYYFWAGLSNVANTYTQAVPSVFAAANAAAVAAQVNDVSTVNQAGVGYLFVLDKVYTRETPMMAYPQQTGLSIQAALATTSATAGEIAVVYAQSAGRPYTLDIPFTLLPAQNFGFNIDYPGVVATPSGFNGRNGIVLNGWFMRATQ